MAKSLNSRPVPFPRGVAAVDEGLGCTEHAGTVFGLELGSGRERWRREVASGVPLAVRGRRLFVAAVAPAGGQPNVLRLRVLEIPGPADGPAVGTGAAHADVTDLADVVFPAWVNTGDADAFRIEASVDGRGIVLEWLARRRYRGGAPPSAQALQGVARDAAGVVRIALAGRREAAAAKGAKGGKVRTVLAEVGPPPAPAMASVRPADESLPYETTVMTARGTSSLASTEPWGLDGRSFALGAEHRGGGDAWLVLRSDGPGDTGLRMEATGYLVRLPADGQPVLPRLTRDGRFLLVRTDASGDASREGSSHCTIFLVDTGRRLRTLPVELDASDPCVLGGRLYFITATALVAARLGDALREWTWPLPTPRTAPAKTAGPPPLRR